MIENQVLDIGEFIKLLKKKKQTKNDKIIVFVGAAISIKPPSRLPSADSLLDNTLNILLDSHNANGFLMVNGIRKRIEIAVIEASKERWFQPELFYDAIYEHVGDKTFQALNSLKNGQPNENHKLLAELLAKGYIDYIITTNFDDLVEKAVKSKSLWRYPRFRKRIWKIHGDINKPETMVTTFRRLGQSLFDDSLLTNLKNYLANAHVLFIGYGGTDPDLNPALIQAKMGSVYWVAYNQEEFDKMSRKEPWMSIDKNTGAIKWIIGDLYDSALAKIEAEIFPDYRKETEDQSLSHIQRMRSPDIHWLGFQESVSVLLQILYNLAEVSPSSQIIWDLVGEVADELLAHPRISNEHSDKLIRDLHAFRAEAHLQKGEKIAAKHHLAIVTPFIFKDLIQARVLLNMGVILTDEPIGSNEKEAENMLMNALQTANQVSIREPGRLPLQARCHANLAVLRIRQNRPYEASKHFEIAAEFFKKAGSLLEHIALLINQARHFAYLGDKVNVLECFFQAETELMNFPKHPLNSKLRDLEQEISQAGVNIVEIREYLHPNKVNRPR